MRFSIPRHLFYPYVTNFEKKRTKNVSYLFYLCLIFVLYFQNKTKGPIIALVVHFLINTLQPSKTWKTWKTISRGRSDFKTVLPTALVFCHICDGVFFAKIANTPFVGELQTWMALSGSEFWIPVEYGMVITEIVVWFENGCFHHI